MVTLSLDSHYSLVDGENILVLDMNRMIANLYNVSSQIACLIQ